MQSLNQSCRRVRLQDVLSGRRMEPYIVAEISCNHQGNKNNAIDLIRSAAETGVDAVKIQTFKPETMTIKCDNPDFVIQGGLWHGWTLYDLYEKAQTPWEWTPDIFKECANLGLEVFSSPFDETAVDFLEQFKPPAYKIASLEVTDHELLRKVAQTRRPVILSTGASTLEEVDRAVNTLKASGAAEVVLLHCVSGYPTSLCDANLNRLVYLKDKFNIITGLSDHSPGDIVACGAVALGARIIEKHFILDKNDGSLDAEFSLEPHEFKELVKRCKETYISLGNRSYSTGESEKISLLNRRSLYIVEDCAAGEKLTRTNVRSIRPGYGLSSEHYANVLGRTVKHSMVRGTPLSFEDLA